MAGGLAQADVPGNDGLEDLIPEHPSNLVHDLPRQVGALVEHGHDDTRDHEPWVEGLPDALDRLGHLGDALEGQVLALDRDHHPVGRRERIERQKTQGGRAIDEDELVGPGLREHASQAEFAILRTDQLDLGADQILGRGNEREVGKRLDGKPRLLEGRLAEKDVVQRRALRVIAKPKCSCCVRLWICVDQEGTALRDRQRRSEIHGAGSLADAAFLIDDCDDPGQGTPPMQKLMEVDRRADFTTADFDRRGSTCNTFHVETFQQKQFRGRVGE